MKWYLIDQDGWIVNAVIWDGVSEYSPPYNVVSSIPDGLDIGHNVDGRGPPEPEAEL